MPGDTLYQQIKVGNEFYFPELGFSVNVKQTSDPGESLNEFTNFNLLTVEDDYAPQPNAFLRATISYENGTSDWLDPIADQDGEMPYNWIRSGSNKTEGTEDAYYTRSTTEIISFYDKNQQFGEILGGTWAPYALTSSYYAIAPSGGSTPARIFCGPGFSGEAWKQDGRYIAKYGSPSTNSAPDRGNVDIRKLSSTLIVYTPDKSKWTRCVVLEMQEKSQLSQGNALFFQPRNHPSVDKQGISYGANGANAAEAALTSTTGMGWFPGYAINIETGERLNMAFGEDSYQRENNGDDMIWNPTSNENTPYPYAFGGKHFVYVFSGNAINSTFPSSGGSTFKWEPTLSGKSSSVGRYDHGKRMMEILQGFFVEAVLSTPSQLNSLGIAPLNAFERDIMWTSIPMPRFGVAFKDPSQMPSEVRVQINVSKPYRYGWSGMADIPSQLAGDVNKLVSVNNPSVVTKHVSAAPKNNNFPLYTFNTSDIATLYDQTDVAKNALDLIRIVPNPYYGSSTYEARRTDNFVRITNVPNKCTIKIFTMNGTLVRTIKRDVSDQEDQYSGVAGGGDDIKRSKRISYAEWDLKNQSNISVASGLYIFHIDAPGVGEKILKWFGVMRPLDVQNY